MITTILSIAGMGGIGAALWLIPGFLPAILAFLRTVNPLVLLAIAGVAFGALQLAEKRHALKTLASCESGRAADWAAWQSTYDVAVAKATAAKRTEETRTAAIKEHADAALDTARDDADKRLAAYIMRHRPVARPASDGNLPGTLATAEVDHGTGGTAEVDASDLTICTANTSRLVNAHDWGVALGKEP